MSAELAHNLDTEAIGLGLTWELLPCASEAEWLAQRKTGVGASESACLLHLSDYDSAYSLFLDKVGKAPSEKSNPRGEAYKRWGQLVEEPIATLAAEALGVPALTYLGRYTVLRSVEHPRMLATLDRLCPPIPGQQGWGVVELKWTTSYDTFENPPTHYQCQVQHQLAVTGLKWGALAIVHNGSINVSIIERNDKFIAMLQRAVGDFWSHVETGLPPPADASPATSEALRHLGENGATIELPKNLAEVDEKFCSVKAEIAELIAIKDKLQDQLIAAIGTASVGRIAGTPVTYSFKTVNKKSYTVAASSSRQLKRALAKEEIQ